MTIATIMATSLIFTACGGGGGSTAGTGTGTTAGTGAGTTGGQQTTSKVVPLNIREATAIQAGYSIVDSDDDAVLEVLVSGETRTVILKSGMASIKMPI